MGAISFDPSPWLNGGQGDPAKDANFAKDATAAQPSLATVAALAGSVPASVVMGLRTLRPASLRGLVTTVWTDIVADARRLESDGWGATALALGWSALDLWGVSDRREGLAVWLAGRPIVLLDADTAVVIGERDRRHQYTRCRQGMPGAKLLWEIDQ